MHEVAVVISAHENLHKEREEEKPTPSWRKRLQQWVSTARPARKTDVIVVFSLQSSSSTYYSYRNEWQLKAYYMPVQVFSTQGIDQDVLLEPDRLDIVLRHYELTPGVKEISGIRMLDRLQLVNASPVPQSLLAFMLGSEVPPTSDITDRQTKFRRIYNFWPRIPLHCYI